MSSGNELCRETDLVNRVRKTEMISVGVSNDRAATQSFSRQLLSALDQVYPHATPCGVCGGRSVAATRFNGVLHFTPVNINSPLLHIQSCIIWRMEKGSVKGSVLRRHSLTPLQQKRTITMRIEGYIKRVE